MRAPKTTSFAIAVLLLGCGASTEIFATDVGIDATSFDARIAPETSAISDARVQTDAVTRLDVGVNPIRGTVTYDSYELANATLVPRRVPLRTASVALLAGEQELARTLTDAEGGYVFARDPAATHVRVYAGNDDVGTTDFAENQYVVRAPIGDVHIREEQSSGAFAIASTLTFGLRYAQRVLPSDYGNIWGRWERGNLTPRQWTYASPSSRGDDQIFILGSPQDSDEFDVPVLLHEFGHLVQYQIDINGMGDGDPHAEENTTPGQAWDEGWATFFASAARNDPSYWDSRMGRAGSYALDALPRQRAYMGDPNAPLAQNHSEYLVASVLYRLLQLHTLAEQEPRLFSRMVERLARAPNRGALGIDLVDALDAYLCLAPNDVDAVRNIVVVDRTFPYTAAGPCNGKPGDPTQLMWHPPVPLAGTVVIDARGQRLREMRIDSASTPVGVDVLRTRRRNQR